MNSVKLDSAHASQRAIQQLAKTPIELRALLQSIPPERAQLKPSLKEFSILENVCHLRDLELEGYIIRVERILEQDNPVLADFNGAKLAAERDYNNQELQSALSAFTNARAKTVALLRAASPEVMTRTGMLEGVGEISLGRLVEMMQQHDEEHLSEVTALCLSTR